MSRCARCGHLRMYHEAGVLLPLWMGDPGEHLPCRLFTPPDPWWIRLLARIGKGRL